MLPNITHLFLWNTVQTLVKQDPFCNQPFKLFFNVESWSPLADWYCKLNDVSVLRLSPKSMGLRCGQILLNRALKYKIFKLLSFVSMNRNSEISFSRKNGRSHWNNTTVVSKFIRKKSQSFICFEVSQICINKIVPDLGGNVLYHDFQTFVVTHCHLDNLAIYMIMIMFMQYIAKCVLKQSSSFAIFACSH